MSEKSNVYSKFKLRADNRNIIRPGHVAHIKRSIQEKNLMTLKPILVNENFEILDGQHRFLALKELGLPIVYEKSDDLAAEDIIRLNISKAWALEDFLNFYVKNGNDNYIALNDFIKKNNINLKMAVNYFVGKTRNKIYEFKTGKMIFKENSNSEYFDFCHEVEQFIRDRNGGSQYLKSNRFWSALIRLAKHPVFLKEKFMKNLDIFSSRMGPKLSEIEYLKCILSVYNYRNKEPIPVNSFIEKGADDTIER